MHLKHLPPLPSHHKQSISSCNPVYRNVRPKTEYSSQSEAYSEASREIHPFKRTQAHTAILGAARYIGSGDIFDVSNRLIEALLSIASFSWFVNF